MPSKNYLPAMQQMAEMHRTRKVFSGSGILKHRHQLVEFSRRLDCRSGLDYGCGKGRQYDPAFAKGYDLAGALGFKPFLWDPAVPEFKLPPPTDMDFDLVMCVDVLECIPKEDLPWVAADLWARAHKGLFVTVASYPSKKELPNGQNAHITIEGEEFWHGLFRNAAKVADARAELILLVA